MQQKVDLSEMFGGFIEYGADVVVVRRVHRQQESRIGFFVGQLGHPSPIPLTFVVGAVGQMSESAGAALIHDLLGNRPSDRMIVGDPENQTFFSLKLHQSTSWQND